MKRLLGILITLVCMVGMSVSTAFATIDISDNLSIKGQMRVRFWDRTNYAYSDTDSAQRQYWDQRYRLWVKVKPEDNIQAVLRFDFVDAMWGDDSYGTNRYNAASEVTDDNTVSASDREDSMEVGRAYLVVERPDFKIVGGLDNYKLGNNLSYENLATGITVQSTRLPVNVRVGYTLENELGARDDENEDEITYFVEVDSAKLVKGHLFKAFYAFAQSGDTMPSSTTGYNLADDNDYEAHLFGLSAKGKLMDKKLFYRAELDFITGDKDSGVDIFGQQFWLEANYAVSKKFKVGGHFVYAKGSDDPNEDQFDSIHDGRSDSWDIQVYGPYKATWYPFGCADVLDVEGYNSGAIAGALYASYKITPKLEVYGQYLYVAAESEGNRSGREFKNADVASVSARYNLTKSTEIAGIYGISSIENDGTTYHDDTEKTFSAFLRVKF